MIDFQTAGINSFANDLSTLLIFCTTKQVRDECFESLIEFYFHEVRRILGAFGCDPDKILPRALYEKHLKNSMLFGVRLAIFGLPVMLADDSEIKVDMHKADGSVKLFSDLVQVENPETINRLKRRLTDLVSDCDKWGYI